MKHMVVFDVRLALNFAKNMYDTIDKVDFF